MDLTTPTQLNPLQQDFERLLDNGGERPTFPESLRPYLRSLLEESIDSSADGYSAAKPLFVRKHDLDRIHQCEAHWLAEDSNEFSWSPRATEGTVAHKAIELMTNSRADRPPAEWVDLAIERHLDNSDDSHSPGTWLSGASTIEVDEVRRASTDFVIKFVETVPPLSRTWRPRVESRVRTLLCQQRVVLTGKMDLVLGSPTGLTAGSIVIDFKTGGARSAHHRADLIFYALLETLRVGVPPWRAATIDLSSGQALVDDITVEMLEAGARRVVAGVRKIAELRAGRQPIEVVGPQCSWCIRRDVCETAARESASDASF